MNSVSAKTSSVLSFLPVFNSSNYLLFLLKKMLIKPELSVLLGFKIQNLVVGPYFAAFRKLYFNFHSSDNQHYLIVSPVHFNRSQFQS